MITGSYIRDDGLFVRRIEPRPGPRPKLGYELWLTRVENRIVLFGSADGVTSIEFARFETEEMARRVFPGTPWR